jgi:methoxymalonate biosynthesis protein
MIKCVVWDLDNTLWQGVAAEAAAEQAPEPKPEMLDIIAELEKRGIVSSVASRNDPSSLESLLSHPSLQGLFAAPQVSWEPKSMSVRRIADNLNIGLDAVAFVDDSPFERAEVQYMLPDVLVLSPEEIGGAMDTAAFSPAGSTHESAQRANMYRQEDERRRAETAFKGDRASFMAWCEMRLVIAPATEADLPRIHELTERTHQLNSTGRSYSLEQLRERLSDPRWLMPAARLTDRFGDYGLIGAALVDTTPPWPADVWLVELIMLSCRVEGRGIPAALLRWILGEAVDAGMKGIKAVYRINQQNLPIRLLFRQMGFSKVAGDSLVTVERDLSTPLPDYPPWLHVVSDK